MFVKYFLDGWMDGRRNGWTDGQVDRWIDGCVDGKWVVGWMMSGKMDG
jgi:hypothetical protein